MQPLKFTNFDLAHLGSYNKNNLTEPWWNCMDWV